MKRLIKAVLVLLVLEFFLGISEGCRCIFRHPQEHLCTSDYAMSVQVKSVKYSDDPNGIIEYTVMILERFKTGEAMVDVVKNLHSNEIKIYTYNSSAACGITLQRHKDYILVGRISDKQLWISSCDYYKPLDEVTNRLLELFRYEFKRCCHCKIDRCPYNDKSQIDCSLLQDSKSACKWSDNFLNQTECGVCKSDRYGAPCQWEISCVPLHDADGSSSSSQEQNWKKGSSSSSEEKKRKKSHYHH